MQIMKYKLFLMESGRACILFSLVSASNVLWKELYSIR